MKLSFKEGDWVDFDTWTTEFGVSGQSGINTSKKNRLIVCTTDIPPYEDDWYSNDQWDGVRFTGQGKSLNENGKYRYLYCGIFVLKTLPRKAEQKDINGNKRNVFVFNLAAKNGRLHDDVKNAMKQAGLKIRLI